MEISIVLTTYNGELYISELLDSLRCQTMQADEVLIFDDASNDKTVDLINNYIKQNSLHNWKLYINNLNVGWKNNFHNAILKSTGDIVFLCDQDDIWHSDKIEKMVLAMCSNDDIELLACGYKTLCNINGRYIIEHNIETVDNSIVSKVCFDEHYYLTLRPGCTMAFRRSLILLYDKIWTPGTPHDSILWTLAGLRGKLYLYRGALIDFRRHASNASELMRFSLSERLNEIDRTLLMNEWYLNNFKDDIIKIKIVYNCNSWCQLRKELLKNKRIICWIKMFKYKDFYMSYKHFLAELYFWWKCYQIE